jgi:P4 family phage/plasmid primase-like protien
VNDDLPDFDDDAIDATAADMRSPVDFKLGDHVELGRTLLEELDATGPRAVFDLGELHQYDEASGLWRAIDRARQSRIVQGFSGRTRQTQDGPRKLTVKLNDVRGALALAADQASHPGFFHDAPRGLAFADRFVRVEGGAISVEEHAPEHRSRLGYPFAFDTRAPIRWLQFLEEVFRDDADKQDRITFIHEFFGATLLGIAPRFNKCAVFVGQGGEGKGTLLKIMLAAMPDGSTCSIAPQKLCGEYYRAQLAGKLLNAVSELPEADILVSEDFKAIVSGDLTSARTIRESPFTFAPIAGHAFSANKLPGTNDQTIAFWDRFIVLPFTRRMRDTASADPRIAEKIIANELPAIVASLVQHGARMQTSATYAIPQSHHAALEAWRKSADQVAMFVDERLTTSRDAKPSSTSPHDWTSAETLYRAYRVWADDAGHRSPLARNKFTSRLVALGVQRVETKQGSFYGVTFNSAGGTGGNGSAFQYAPNDAFLGGTGGRPGGATWKD